MLSLRAGDTGVAIDIRVVDRLGAVDISAADTIEMQFISPSGLLVTKTAAFKTDGKDGVMTYLTIPTDFVELGMWGVQGHVVISGSEYDAHTAIGTFRVEKAL